MIIISGLTDCVDGFVARHFNQVSDFGKILDPVADKLTLLAVGIGICILTPEVITVMVILIIKDLLMLIGGIALIKMIFNLHKQDGTERLEQFCSIFLYVLLLY